MSELGKSNPICGEGALDENIGRWMDSLAMLLYFKSYEDMPENFRNYAYCLWRNGYSTREACKKIMDYAKVV